MALTAIPLELKQVNDFVNTLHRHHNAVYRDKFRCGAVDSDGILRAVIQCARPVSRRLDDGKTIEVTRLCSDGYENACSFLYSRMARIAKELGYEKIITYILETENGASLKASGWICEKDVCGGGNWSVPSRPRETTAPQCKKQRWVEISNMTNYQRIKAMSVEEMAVMLSDMCKIAEDCPHCPFYDNCPESEADYNWEQWLESEVQG